MKAINKLCMVLMLFVLMLPAANRTKAQTGAKSLYAERDNIMRYAYCLVNGTDVTMDTETASALFSAFAGDGDAEAHNALGMMYKHGLGTNRNDENAFFLFSKAAELGYAKAYYNLGLMYRFGHYVTQNLDSATVFFAKAKEAGYNTDYITGYSQFKGMGEKQSYANAFDSFRQGAGNGNSGSMFMLGLCFLQGRGTEQNIERGKFWIEQAVNRGSKQALDFICENKSESFIKNDSPQKAKKALQPIDRLIPPKFVTRENAVTESVVGGLWEGKIITYDWSGEEIEEESPLHLSLDVFGNAVKGIWTEADTASTAITAMLDNTGWAFDNITLYTSELPVELRTAGFMYETTKDGEFLHGNVSFYCDAVREYTAPKYIVLKRIGKNTTKSENENDIPLTVYPNPFDDEIRIDFSLNDPEELRFALYNAEGKQLYISGLKKYPAGINSHNIPTEHIVSGAYTLRVAGKSVNQTVKLIK